MIHRKILVPYRLMGCKAEARCRHLARIVPTRALRMWSMAKSVRSADWFALYGTPFASKAQRLRMAPMERLPALTRTAFHTAGLSLCKMAYCNHVIDPTSNQERRIPLTPSGEASSRWRLAVLAMPRVLAQTRENEGRRRAKEICKWETVALSYKDFECDAPDNSSPILITHGLLGSKNNWNSVAKSLRKTLQRRVVTADARNHGDSPWTAQHDYGSMSRDFLRLLDHLNVEKTIFVGHSMGGRTGVTFALHHPERLEKLIVVDITPGEYRGSNALSFVKLLDDVAWDEAENLAQVRRNVDAQLASRIGDIPMRQFLLTNLVSDGDRVRWKCNLKALIENGENLMGHADYPETRFRGPTLFVAGSDSNFVRAEDMAGIRLLFPKAELTVVPDAGHWVHSDNPRRFLEVVAEFCARPEAL